MVSRWRTMLVATAVYDVSGNWVRYNYDSLGRLTKIYSNDGRKIDVGYNGSSLLVAFARANGDRARKWTYGYGRTNHHYPEWNVNGQNLDQSLNRMPHQLLRTVEQADGKSWQFSLDGMAATPSPAIICKVPSAKLNVTHPHGAQAEFRLNQRSHRSSFDVPVSVLYKCPNLEPESNVGRPDPPFAFHVTKIDTMSVTSKKVSGTSISPSPLLWNYEYQQSDVLIDTDWAHWLIMNNLAYKEVYDPFDVVGTSSDDRTNWTLVTEPSGHKKKYYHFWTMEPASGKLDRMEIISASEQVLQKNQYTYSLENKIGSTNRNDTSNVNRPIRTTKTVTFQDGDIFTTEMDYKTNQSSADYSYGNPVQTKTYSNVSSLPRVTDTTYTHNKTKWVLGLPKTVTQNGRQLATYAYDRLGRKISQTRYGQPYATFTYNSDGTFSGIKDALNRQTAFYDWKRGTPQRIKRPDQLSVYQYVDANGWLTQTKDAKSYITHYQHDSMGRLTQIEPQGAWDNTAIAYDFTGGGAVQTITKGQSKITITYDSQFRPILEKTEDLTSSWASYVNTKYDASGRVEFKSHPSSSAIETAGIRSSYDALDRVKSKAETVSPYATTTLSYLSGHRTRKTYPNGHQSVTYRDGYGGPGGGEVLRIDEPLGRKTYLNRNIWGEVETIRQSGAQAGVSLNITQSYAYDSQRRVCRYYTPEGGATLYEYNAGGEVVAYAKGQLNSGCSVPKNANHVKMDYDTLGRVTSINYSDTQTRDIIRRYGGNGNIVANDRGGINWSYAYNPLNLLTRETLSLDGRQYDFTYQYNSAGQVISQTQPGLSAPLSISRDGLGRTMAVSSGPQSFASNFTYHPDGQVQNMTFGNGHAYIKTLNARLLPARVQTQKGVNRVMDLSYRYDALGKITTITNAVNSTQNQSFTYDGLGQVKTAAGSWGAGTYKYDSLGNIRQKVLGSKTLNMSYNSQNRLVGYTDTSGPDKTLSYDRRGNVTTLTESPDTSHCIVTKSFNYLKAAGATRWSHTARVNTCTHQVVSIETTTQNPNLTPVQQSFSFPAFNRGETRTVTGQTFAVPNSTYYTVYLEVTYSVNNMLSFRHRVKANGSANYSSWVYHGSRSFFPLPPSPPPPIAPPTPQTEDLTFTYDSADQPIKVSGKAVGTYHYDGNFKRVKSIINGKTLYNIYNAAGELAGVYTVNTDEMTAYIRADGQTVARVTKGVASFIHSDHLGSAQTATDGQGLIVFQEYYTPFGEVINASAANDYQAGFTGHIRDTATGLTYMQARYYNPNIGRFLSIDPVGFMDAKMNPGMFNRYSYTYNDPINKTDPTGMLPPEGTVSGELASGHSLEHAQGISDAFAPASEAGFKGMVTGLSMLPAGKAAQGTAIAGRSLRFKSRLNKVRQRLKGWKETKNRKGTGSRFQDPTNKGNRVRVDKGNPNHNLRSQKKDHVVEQRGGKTVDSKGDPIQGPKPSKTEEAHVPLKNWLKDNK